MSGIKLIKGTAWSLAGQGTSVAVSALTTPFIVRQMGAAEYGVLTFLNLLTSYLAYTDLGMGTASTRFASLEGSAGTNREAEVIWTGISLSTILGTFFAVCLIAFAPPICDGVLHVGPALRSQSVLALRIVSVAFLLKNVTGVMNTPQLVRLRFDTYTAITSGSVVLQIVLTPIILWFGGSLVTIAATITAINFLALCLHFSMGHRLLPQLWPPRLNIMLFRPLLKFGVLIVLSQFPELILTNAERFGLTYFTSVSSLAYYSIAYTYANLALIAAIAVGQVLLPTFSGLQSQSRESELLRLYRRSIVTMCFMLAPAAVLLAVAARPILSVLLGLDYGHESTPACYWLLIGVVFSGTSYVPGSMLFAGDRGGIVARIRWYELAPYIVISASFTLKYGIVGAAAAWTLRAFVDSLLLNIAVQKWRNPLTFSFSNALRLAGVLALLSPPLIAMTVFELRWGWIVFLMCVSLVLYGVNLWRLILTSSEKYWITSWSRRLLAQGAGVR